MRRLLMPLLFVAACGPKPSPATGGGGTSSKDPPAAGPAAPVTCDEAAVILRGTVEDAKSGPSKEQVIVKACKTDKWADAVVQCVGSQARAGNCVEGLTEEQKASYGKQMQAWYESHPDEPMTFEETGWEPPPPPHVWTCAEGLGDPAAYAPALTATGEDRELAVGLRKPVIRAACENGGWSQDVLACLQNTAPETCRAKLEPAKQKPLADKLAEVDALVAKIQAATKKPAATFDCKKVVATHYADAAWKGKLADAKPKDRTKAIADSRAAMTKACTDEKWSGTARACVVVGGGDACFAASGHAGRWGFPALMVEAKTGIPECDLVLAHIDVLSRCEKAPSAVRDAYRKASEQMIQAWKAIPPDQKGVIAAACKQSDEAIVSSAAQLGCSV